MTADLTNKTFTNEISAIEHMEDDRWPNGVSCPLCGADRPKKMGGKTQAGMFLCPDCRGKFSVRTGTVFERSHIPLHKWLLATHLMASSKKGISARQLHRMLGITYKSAWFMAHRIREAMAPVAGSEPPLGGEGKVIEADETYYGKRAGETRAQGNAHCIAVVALVESGGKVRSFKVGKARKIDTDAILKGNADKASTLMTDESRYYKDGVRLYRTSFGHSFQGRIWPWSRAYQHD
jgi:transposase-like protein